ncbi:hypothetical protein [Vibrio sp. Isolate24]|uniref:hypothetical protein n=1 Tax=Vibrio sp. Isolate24 TaxID=2908534 RepID=UPI001EFDE4D0|nr:hypothetical protein [Vibrio sp. Isolate24]MCG9679294.1 hypothetical protein [Vibrio sp. Isolate24]
MRMQAKNLTSELSLNELMLELWNKKLIIAVSIVFGVLSLLALSLMKPVQYEQKGEFSFYTDSIFFGYDQKTASSASFDYINNRSFSDFALKNSDVDSQFNFSFDPRKKLITLIVRGEDESKVERDFNNYKKQISTLAKQDLIERRETEHRMMIETFNSQTSDKVLEAIAEKIAVIMYVVHVAKEPNIELMAVSKKYENPIKTNEKNRKLYILLGALLGGCLSTVTIIFNYLYRSYKK